MTMASPPVAFDGGGGQPVAMSWPQVQPLVPVGESTPPALLLGTASAGNNISNNSLSYRPTHVENRHRIVTDNARSDIVSFPNDIGDPETHPIYSRLDGDEAAIRAFNKLILRQKDEDGRINILKGSTPLPLLENADAIKYELVAENNDSLESAFGRPPGYLCFHRNFFPPYKEYTKLLPTYALFNLENRDAIEQDQLDMIAFMKHMHRIFKENVTSKVEMDVSDALHQNPIKLENGVLLTDFKKVRKHWDSALPTNHVAKQVHDFCYMYSWDKTRVALLVSQVCASLRIFFPLSDTEKDTMKCGSTDKRVPRTVILTSMVTDRFHSNFRRKINDSSHGIKVTISKSKREGRRKKSFCLATDIKGLDSEQYLTWVRNSTNKAAPPSTVRCASIPIHIDRL